MGLSYWQSHKVPERIELHGQLQKDPLQTETTKKTFSTETKGHRYQIVPIYDYEIWGLVVSDHSSDSWIDTDHEAWNDYINTKDICLIWGENISNPHLSKFDFSHGNFTCYVKTSSSEAWQSFQKDKLSNNHLIPSNHEIGKLIANSHVGDVVRIKGQLVNYNVDEGPFRKTSTLRTDMENGACEIIYVNEFETLTRNNIIWIQIFTLSKIVCLGLILALLFQILLPLLGSSTNLK